APERPRPTVPERPERPAPERRSRTAPAPAPRPSRAAPTSATRSAAASREARKTIGTPPSASWPARPAATSKSGRLFRRAVFAAAAGGVDGCEDDAVGALGRRVARSDDDGVGRDDELAQDAAPFTRHHLVPGRRVGLAHALHGGVGGGEGRRREALQRHRVAGSPDPAS